MEAPQINLSAENSFFGGVMRLVVGTRLSKIQLEPMTEPFRRQTIPIGAIPRLNLQILVIYLQSTVKQKLPKIPKEERS